MTTAQPLPEDVDALKALIVQAGHERARLHAQLGERDGLIARLHTEFHALMRQAHAEFDASTAQLQAEHQAQMAQLRAEYRAALEAQREKLRLLLAQRFAAGSERLAAQAGQYLLFDEAETDAAGADDDARDEEADAAAPDTVAVAAHTRVRGHRRPLPEALPRVQVVHDLPEHNKRCPHDGTTLECIGEDVGEQLDLVPARVQVLRHVRLKYACPCCRAHVVGAPMPAQPIPRSQASPGLLATVAVGKYIDALPLYRQSAQFARIGVDLPRQTLAHWMVRCGQLVQPLINLLRDRLLESGYLQMDETTAQVLKEPGKPAQSQSYMWVQRSADVDRPVVLFDYDPSRSGQVPVRLLAGFKGVLQTDGYAGYDAAVAANGLTQIYCMAHARRYFTDALKGLGLNPGRLPPKPPDKARRLIKALGFFAKLYAIEHRIRHEDPERRYAVRQDESVPTLTALKAWADEIAPQVLPGSGLGKALAYLRAHWDGLIRYCDDGRLAIDNNPCENAIRPFALGRKNWLFADTVAGAQASANLYSLILTARDNALEPHDYLRRVFTELPAAATVEDIEKLLPWNLRGAV